MNLVPLFGALSLFANTQITIIMITILSKMCTHHHVFNMVKIDNQIANLIAYHYKYQKINNHGFSYATKHPLQWIKCCPHVIGFIQLLIVKNQSGKSGLYSSI